MNNLENEVKPYLGALVMGERIVMNPLQQDGLARWLWKTAIVQDASLGKGREHFFSAKDARDFFEQPSVPLTARMWFGGYVFDEHPAQLVFSVRALSANPITIGRAMVSTIAVGRVILQVLAVKAGSRVVFPDDPPHGYHSKEQIAVKFWPPAGIDVRPTAFGVPDSDFAKFATRFDQANVASFPS